MNHNRSLLLIVIAVVILTIFIVGPVAAHAIDTLHTAAKLHG